MSSQNSIPCRLLLLGLFCIPVGLLVQSTSADAKQDQEKRRNWEAIVDFYGTEDSNRFSLAIHDRNAKEEGQFHFKEIWKYDHQAKKWVKMDVAAKIVKAVPASEKPKDSPNDAQILVELPIQIQDIGLYYAKWEIDGIPCATFTPVGPRARDRTVPGKPGPGERIMDVPITIDKAELQIIPSPEYHTGEGSLPVPTK
jgi:hypothetical protein